MALDTWLIYLLASIGLSLTPGPNSLLALTHGALYGARRTLFTIVGGVFGFSALIALAMFGLSALLQTSAWLPRSGCNEGRYSCRWIGYAHFRGNASASKAND